MPRLLLARRRLLQISVFDLLLATTGVIALIVNFQALAPRGFIYTAGFFGGLLGTAVAMNRAGPRWWEVLCLGVSVGILSGWIGAIAIEALRHGALFESAWHWQSPRGRVAATNYAVEFGAAGGLAASVLYTVLFDLNARVRRSITGAREHRKTAEPSS